MSNDIELKEILSDINRKLGVIAALLLHDKSISGDEQSSYIEQLKILHKLGIETRDVASILGKNPVQVAKDLYKLRNTKQKKKK